MSARGIRRWRAFMCVMLGVNTGILVLVLLLGRATTMGVLLHLLTLGSTVWLLLKDAPPFVEVPEEDEEA